MMLSFRRSCAFFFFSLFSFPAVSQVNLTGTVVDFNTNQPLSFVHVIVFPAGDGIITDTLGRYNITTNSVDSVKFSHVGYSELTISTYSEGQKIKLMPLPVLVNEIVVEGFNWKRSPVQSPASIDIIGHTELQRYNQVSLIHAVNTMPGVRMEERSPGSYRFSIRGSLLRSPFGVRNVKVYWNGIPYTDAGGNTQLNLIDMNSIERIEVIKGPAASMYGAGTGGVIMLNSASAMNKNTGITLKSVNGYYGLFQNYAEVVATASDQSAYVISYAHQKRGGYRAHSEVDRKRSISAANFIKRILFFLLMDFTRIIFMKYREELIPLLLQQILKVHEPEAKNKIPPSEIKQFY